ncbi:hypothetical protein BDV59DRAFT_196843 [Aspergillus ambiguus]|uniref:uncharacterized protein n=1 Tax=Aspergillus ambiguus TaxID=176160 RepID=UPI003CCD6091
MSPIHDLVAQSADTLHRLSKHKDSVPGDVHRRILDDLQRGYPDALSASDNDQWSDGLMWAQILAIGSSNRVKVTILNMLEYMGAWKWYDNQVRMIQNMNTLAKGKPTGRRGAAIQVLDSIQDSSTSIPHGKWISGIGRRKHISMQLSRGEKLSLITTRKLGLGILFSKRIWEYAKMKKEQVVELVQTIEADNDHTKLLEILGPQLTYLVTYGSPNLQVFYEDLNREGLLKEDEIRYLQVLFPVEETALENLIQGVKLKVLRQEIVRADDTICIGGSNVEIPCDIFERFYPGRWQNAWSILAAMDLSDKPAYIRYGFSIPLDEVGPDLQSKPKQRPLAGWAKKIETFRQQARESTGNAASLVYFCPINHENTHFTLLEINDRERTIRHYDSKINQSRESRVFDLVRAEFGELKYSYLEAPTPQQREGWSCGARVIWNFRRLSNGLPIGSRETVIDPNRILLEIVEALQGCVEDNAMRRYR